MAGSAAFVRTDRGFALRAALLSLVGHAAAFAAVATYVAAPASPDPAPVYTVLFEAAAAPVAGPVPPAPTAAPAPAPAADAAPPPVERTPVEPDPPLPEPAPLVELPLPEPSTPKIARPKPRPPRPVAAPRPVPVPTEMVAQAHPAAAERAEPASAPPGPPVPQAAPVIAMVAETAAAVTGPAPVPVVSEARFQSPPSPPVYPRRAAELGQRGVAVLRALVQPDGSTSEIVLWRSSGFVLLDDAALGAVRQWRFEPARRDGGAILAWVEIPVRFELN